MTALTETLSFAHLPQEIPEKILNIRHPTTVSTSSAPQLCSISTHIALDKLHQPISSLLQARSKPLTISQAKQFHAHIFKFALHSNTFLINCLIRLYVVNGNLIDALQLFHEMVQQDVVSWTTLVDGYAKSGNMGVARKLFDEIPVRNVVTWNVMISGYGKGGDVEAARQMFDEMPQRDVVSWNSLISAYSRNGFFGEAFETFRDMLISDVSPNRVSLLGILPAIANFSCDFQGRCVHSYIIKRGIEMDSVLCSALVDMYSKCICIDMAFQVFERHNRQNVASWNPMLAGFVRNDSFEEALELFRIMQLENVEVDYVTMVVILPAIAYLGALVLGKWAHSFIERNKITVNAILGSALVDMYSKCGHIEFALQVFSRIGDKTVELWNAMITGLGIHGKGRDALKLLSQMMETKFKLDDITFAAALNACSHSGLVEDGLSLLAAMNNVYKVTPKIQHYGCVVDLLGRSGLLEEAKELIRNMPIRPDVVIWKSLLGACKIHGNVEIGELAARHLIEVQPSDSSSYVLMSNIYDAVGSSNDAIAMRKMMNDGKIRKEPGFSSIELDGVVHEFLVGDKSHPRAEETYAMLDEMGHKLKLIGYAPDTKLVLFDIDEEEKEVALCHHSEKLAIAFGLISSAYGEPLHVVKNLRMCDDCHVVTKLLSKIYNREIIVRDHRRFHHFRNGRCSCKDYW